MQGGLTKRDAATPLYEGKEKVKETYYSEIKRQVNQRDLVLPYLVLKKLNL